jgi:hypothetical protein
MNIKQEQKGRVKDGATSEGMIGARPLVVDGLIWDQLFSQEVKSKSPLAGRSSHVDSKINQADVDGSELSNGILKGLLNGKLGSEVKFSITFPGRQSIDVGVVENKNFWQVNISVNDRALRKKIKRLRNGLERSMGQELEKRVVVSVG